jgi:hypothetical protein
VDHAARGEFAPTPDPKSDNADDERPGRATTVVPGHSADERRVDSPGSSEIALRTRHNM